MLCTNISKKRKTKEKKKVSSLGNVLPKPPFFYLNDVTYTSNVLDFILFADDTTIFYLHENIENKVDVVNA